MSKTMTDQEMSDLISRVLDSIEVIASLREEVAINQSASEPMILKTYFSLCRLAADNAESTDEACRSILETIMNNRYISMVIVEVMHAFLSKFFSLAPAKQLLRSSMETVLANPETSQITAHRIRESLGMIAARVESADDDEEGDDDDEDL